MNVADVTAEFRFVPGQQEQGFRIGVIGVSRLVVGPFPESQVELLQTFADQAAIAIENVRLFKELEAANSELGAASRHKSEFLANMSPADVPVWQVTKFK